MTKVAALLSNTDHGTSFQEIDEFGIKPGADVFYAPGSAEYSHFVFVEALRK